MILKLKLHELSIHTYCLLATVLKILSLLLQLICYLTWFLLVMISYSDSLLCGFKQRLQTSYQTYISVVLQPKVQKLRSEHLSLSLHSVLWFISHFTASLFLSPCILFTTMTVHSYPSEGEWFRVCRADGKLVGVKYGKLLFNRDLSFNYSFQREHRNLRAVNATHAAYHTSFFWLILSSYMLQQAGLIIY